MTQTYNELSKFFNKDLTMLARELNYSESNLLILNKDESLLKSKFPTIYRNIQSCVHNKDTRSSMDYARDLVSSWIFEDYLVNEFTKRGYTLKLIGGDSNREILSAISVKAESDTLFIHDSYSCKIEIINDYTGFWNKTHKMHLRDNKFLKIKNENSLILAISILTKQYAIINPQSVKYKYVSSHKPYGYKPAYELDLASCFNEFDIDQIIKDLINNKKDR